MLNVNLKSMKYAV